MAGRHLIGGSAIKNTGFVNVAQLVVASPGGNVDIGVPIRQGILSGRVKSVRLNGSIVAQADRGTVDLDGYARWFHLSASQLTAGTYTISVSTSDETATPVSFSDVAATTVVANGGTFVSTDAIVDGLKGSWRTGPVVIENVYDREIGGNKVRVRFVITKWVHGESRCQVFIDNAYSIPGAGYNTWTDPTAPVQVVHDISCSRSGSTTENFTGIVHPCFTTVMREFGDQPCFSSLQAIGFSGTVAQGHFEYVRDSRMYQAYRLPFATQNFAAYMATTPPGSPVDGDIYTPDIPYQKSYIRSGGVWVTPSLGYNGGRIGPISCRNTGGGDDADIGQHPGYLQAAVCNWSSTARDFMRWTIRRRLEINANLRDTTTKKLYRTDAGVNYVAFSGAAGVYTQLVGGTQAALVITDGAALANSTTFTSAAAGFTAGMVGMPIFFLGGGTNPLYEEYRIITAFTNSSTVTLNASIHTSNVTGATCVVNAAMINQYWEQAHWGAVAYLPYLMTGEYGSLEMQLRQELQSWLGSPYGDGNPANPQHGAFKGGQYRHPFALYWDQYYDVGTGQFPQERQQGWAVRTTTHTCAIMPEDSTLTNALFGWDKAMVRTRWSNVLDGLYNCYVVGSTTRFPTSPVGCRFLQAEYAVYPCNSWMHGIIGVALCFGKWLGEMTANGYTFTKWLLDGHAALYADSTNPAMREYLYGSDGNVTTTKDGLPNYWASPGNPCKTWLEVYTRQNVVAGGTLPAANHANWNRTDLRDSDWFGYRMDMMADAQSFGCSQGSDAYTFCLDVASHFNGGNTWVYSNAHNIAPRTA